MPNQKGLISIIMGVYNGADRLDPVIQSIFNQTYTNWEFIICDDSSTDNTWECLNKYSNDSRMKLIRNEKNLGLAATLNHCIEYCSGEYIARMDDDDISYPSRFERQYEFLEKNKDISFVSSSIDIFDGNEIIATRTLKAYPSKFDLIWNSPFVHPATMFRAFDLMEVDCYRVSQETTRGQDYDLFMRMYGNGLFGANITTPLYRFTVDKGNIKRRTFKARIGEMKIRLHGYKAMGVMPWAAPMILKPLAAYVVMGINNKVKGRKY